MSTRKTFISCWLILVFGLLTNVQAQQRTLPTNEKSTKLKKPTNKVPIKNAELRNSKDSKKKSTRRIGDAPKQQPKSVKQYSYKQFTDNVTVFGSSFNHDESKLLVTSDKSGIFNVYEVDIAKGEMKQLTDSKSTAHWAQDYFPKDDRFIYAADQDGNEINHIYMQEKGKSKDLTPDTSSVNRYNFYGFSRDKKSFFFGSTKRTGKVTDVYEMNLATMEPKMIYENADNLDLWEISDDKQYFVLSKMNTTSDNDLYLYNTKTKEKTHLTPHEGEVRTSPSGFDNNNKYLYYTTDKDGEYTYLMRYNLVSKKHEKFLEEKDASIAYSYTSYNEKYRVVGVDKNAKTTIKIYKGDTKEVVEFPNLPAGEITGVNISDSENLMAFYIKSAKQPSNLYIYDIAKQEHKRLTDNLNPEINPKDLVEPQHITFKSFDGLEVPAILYKPHNASPNNKVPAMLNIHGGPGGQSRMGYNAVAQYLANHGYVVLAVNNRGSSGYGKTFFKLDNQKHGEDDLMDCVESKKFLAKSGYVDMDKVGIMGGSYGGYMTLAALTYQPEEFAVGVDIFGPSNWLRTMKNIPPWWESFKKALYEEMGDPNTADSVRLHKISPVYHAANITKPLMVLQGANDPRVLQIESDEIVEAVRKNGVPVEYLVFEDEGHGFLKEENRIEGYEAILKFLDKHLKNKKSTTPAGEDGRPKVIKPTRKITK